MVTPLKNHYPNLSPKSLENMRNFDFEGWGPTLAAYKKDIYIYIYIYKISGSFFTFTWNRKIFWRDRNKKMFAHQSFLWLRLTKLRWGHSVLSQAFFGIFGRRIGLKLKKLERFLASNAKNWWILSAALLSIPTKQLLKTWTEVSVCKKSDAVLKHFIFLNNVMVSGFVYWTSSNLCQKEWIIIPCDIGSYDGCGSLFLISDKGTLGSF